MPPRISPQQSRGGRGGDRGGGPRGGGRGGDRGGGPRGGRGGADRGRGGGRGGPPIGSVGPLPGLPGGQVETVRCSSYCVTTVISHADCRLELSALATEVLGGRSVFSLTIL